MTENILRSVESRSARQSHLQLVSLGLAVVMAATVVAWLLVRDRRDMDFAVSGAGPALVSQAQRERLAKSVHDPVYWAGARHGFRYELTTTTPGRVFVRYLPDGVRVGDPRPDFLTVGTYPGPRAFADLKRAANREGVAWARLDDRGLVVFATRTPTAPISATRAGGTRSTCSRPRTTRRAGSCWPEQSFLLPSC